MLTDSFELTRDQQKKLKNQIKWGSCLALILWKSYLARMTLVIKRFSGSFRALQQEDSSFKGETTMQKAQDFRFMDLR